MSNIFSNPLSPKSNFTNFNENSSILVILKKRRTGLFVVNLENVLLIQLIIKHERILLINMHVLKN